MEESPSLYESSSPHLSTTLCQSDSYVLSLANLSTSYAASASSPSNKIDLLDKHSLRRIQTLAGHDIATTSIRAVDNIAGMPGRTLISSGRDCIVKIWDDRINSHALRLTNLSNSSMGLLSCDVSPDGTFIAAGTELQSEDAFILYWDPRQPASPIRTHSSTHSDDITTLSFHPTSSAPSLILSGSTDGLLSISNASEDDEDEAVIHVGSWGTSISQAGWYLPKSSNNTGPAVWAASDMETFSLWSNELDQRLSTDIRSPSVHTQSRTWVTDYLITCFPNQGGGLRVYTGSNEGDAVLITPPALLTNSANTNATKKWTLHSSWIRRHVGIVRSILPDDNNQVIVTGGEDGQIHLWSNPSPFPPILDDNIDDVQEGMGINGDVDMDMDNGTSETESRPGKKREREEDEELQGKKSRTRRRSQSR